MRRLAAVLWVVAVAGCAPAPKLEAATTAPPRWVAVLVAGDDSIPVFDHAVDRMARVLRAAGGGRITRLAASRPGADRATRSRVLAAIERLHPAAGQACLVFLTSHGAHGTGVYLAARDEFISPADLDDALQAGCGNAPTVAIVSACYTGNFARGPMARPNRIVLTAARADRPSFGCGAGRDLTYYDGCVLQSFTDLPRDWEDVIDTTDACVTRLETQEHERPSEPQSYVGAAVADLPVPGG